MCRKNFNVVFAFGDGKMGEKKGEKKMKRKGFKGILLLFSMLFALTGCSVSEATQHAMAVDTIQAYLPGYQALQALISYSPLIHNQMMHNLLSVI